MTTELLSLLAQMGIAGGMLLGGGAVWWVLRRNGSQNGQLMQAFEQLMESYRFREGAITDVVAALGRQGEALIKVSDRLEMIQEHLHDALDAQRALVERIDRLFQERKSL